MKEGYVKALIAIVAITGLVLYYVKYKEKQNLIEAIPKPTVTQTVTVTPTSSVTATPTISDEVALRAAVLAKSEIPEGKFEFAIGSNSGVMAKGSVKNSDDMGGAAWFAGKKNGAWIVSYVGQGVPLCAEIAAFNYPASWISHCVDAKGKTVAR